MRAPMVALTVDDGPDPVSTPLILSELRRHGARATFFLIAGRVRDREQLVRQLVAERHEIGNHFIRDRAGIRLEDDEFTETWSRPMRCWRRSDRCAGHVPAPVGTRGP